MSQHNPTLKPTEQDWEKAKRAVMAKWSDAGAHYMPIRKVWSIYAAREQQELGYGVTEIEAWINAASRIKPTESEGEPRGERCVCGRTDVLSDTQDGWLCPDCKCELCDRLITFSTEQVERENGKTLVTSDCRHYIRAIEPASLSQSSVREDGPIPTLGICEYGDRSKHQFFTNEAHELPHRKRVDCIYWHPLPKLITQKLMAYDALASAKGSSPLVCKWCGEPIAKDSSGAWCHKWFSGSGLSIPYCYLGDKENRWEPIEAVEGSAPVAEDKERRRCTPWAEFKASRPVVEGLPGRPEFLCRRCQAPNWQFESYSLAAESIISRQAAEIAHLRFLLGPVLSEATEVTHLGHGGWNVCGDEKSMKMVIQSMHDARFTLPGVRDRLHQLQRQLEAKSKQTEVGDGA